MLTLQFPTNVALNTVLQTYVTQRDKLLGIKLAPFLPVKTQKLRWDIRDNARGLTRSHVLGTDPKIGKRPGSKTKEYEPFYFKEQDVIDESELLRSRELGTLGGLVSIDDEVARTMKDRTDKNFLRAETLIWGMFTGLISLDDDNVKASEVFPIQTLNASNWGDTAAGTPLKDFADVQEKFPGTGASGDGAIGYLNQKTANKFLANKNGDDIRGYQGRSFVAATYGLNEGNKILIERNLPTLQVYNEGYFDDAEVFRFFIPDDVVVVIGKRAQGEVVANFGLTPSLHNNEGGVPSPGFFSFITVNDQPNPGAVSLQTLGQSGNPKISVIGGMYGGPMCWFPNSIVRMDVGA